MMDKILPIISEAQRTIVNHQSGVKKLIVIISSSITENLNSFLFCVDHILVNTKKDSAIERLVKFTCDFFSAADETCFEIGIRHLLLRSQAVEKNVRYRACQMVAGILGNMNPNTEISEETWFAMVETLSPRLRDKNTTVRLWAIKAVGLLQNSDETKRNQIIEEITRLMNSDTLASIRVAAIETILVTNQTLPMIIEKVKDIHKDVRIATLQKLAKDVTTKHITSIAKSFVINYGLNDREKEVKEATISLVLVWIEQTGNKIPRFLHSLNLNTNEQVAEKLETKVITNPILLNEAREEHPNWNGSFASINSSEVLWVRVRCEYAMKRLTAATSADILEALLPDSVILCDLLAEGQAVTSSTQQLLVKYLLEMSFFLENADFSGREKLATICEKMIVDPAFPNGLMSTLLNAWARTQDNRDVIQTSLNLAIKIKSTLIDEPSNETSEQMSEDISVRSMEVICWTLTQLIKMNGGQQSNDNEMVKFEEFITASYNNLQQINMNLRCVAVKCLGLFGMCNEKLCINTIPILMEVTRNNLEETEIRMYALHALTDFAMVYPILFKDNIDFSHLLVLIIDNSSNTNDQFDLIQEGIMSSAKLLFANILTDIRLYSILLKIFFIPEIIFNEDENYENEYSHIQQVLSLFFQACFTMESNQLIFILNSIPDFISDITMSVKQGDIDSSMVENVSQL